MRIRKIFFICVIGILLFQLIGCESLMRKFVRKKKGEAVPQEEMVVAPQEYKDTRTAEEKYRQSFMFWKAWQDELIESLIQNESNKKRVDCANEALKNLADLRGLLAPEKQKLLDSYISRLKDLRDMIADDTYGINSEYYRQKAESIRRCILQHYSYSDIKNSLL